MMATSFVKSRMIRKSKQRLEAERMRLRKIAGLDRPDHSHRPAKRAFTAEERSHVTILFEDLHWKHEDLIRAVFQGCGDRCKKLPVQVLEKEGNALSLELGPNDDALTRGNQFSMAA